MQARGHRRIAQVDRHVVHYASSPHEDVPHHHLVDGLSKQVHDALATDFVWRCLFFSKSVVPATSPP